MGAAVEARGLVSVVIPFFNSERFLPEAVESVFAQSYPHWELILVDDGSTDRSTAIARDYVARNPGRVTYAEHAAHCNRGISPSRNLGVQHSRGEYLASLDSDDVWMPEKLEEDIRLAASYPQAGMLCGMSEFWYDWDPCHPSEEQNFVPPILPGGKLYFPVELMKAAYPLGPGGSPCPSTFFFRRRAYELVGGFEESFHSGTSNTYEDQAMLAKLYLKIPIYVSEHCWVRYRLHSTSVGAKVYGTPREESERRFFFRWLLRLLLRNRILDPGIWRLFIRATEDYWVTSLPGVPRLVRYLRRNKRTREVGHS